MLLYRQMSIIFCLQKCREVTQPHATNRKGLAIIGNVNVRVMDCDKDYKRMGTKKGVIETWEDGKRDDNRAGVLVYTIRQQYELESRDAGEQMPKALLKVLELKDLHPSTTRNFAHGTMEYTDESGATVTREGDMIYEFVYMGMNYHTHMETR